MWTRTISRCTTALFSAALSSWCLAAAPDRVWNYTYNEAGQMTSADGPRDDVIDRFIYNYDSKGDLRSSVNPVGHVVRYGLYDMRGQAGSITDANDVTTIITYDALGRTASRTTQDPGGNSNNNVHHSFQYHDATSLPTWTLLPSGVEINHSYDSALRLTKTTWENGKITYSWNNLSKLTAKQYWGNRTHEFGYYLYRSSNMSYDELGRLIGVSGNNGQSETYTLDHNGNKIGSRDSYQVATWYDYDGLNRLIQTDEALEKNTYFSYDGRNNLTSVTDPRALVTSYSYDGLDNLTQLSSPDTGITENEYDLAGNLIQTEGARGIVTQYAYDALNRVLSITYPNDTSKNVSYTYDSSPLCNYCKGRIAEINDASGKTLLSYNHVGKVTSKANVVNLPQGAPLTLVTTLEYAFGDVLTAINYPNGATVNLTPGTLIENLRQTAPGDRPWEITWKPSANAPIAWVVRRILFEPKGPLKLIDYGNGLILDRTFNQDGYLAQQKLGEFQDLSYGYDLRNDILQITDNLDSQGTVNYGYDALQRLTNTSSRYGVNSYQYDANGNRTERVVQDNNGQRTESYHYDIASNRLLSVDTERSGIVTSRSFTYDGAGNVRSDSRGDAAGLQQDYDVSNRLTRVRP